MLITFKSKDALTASPWATVEYNTDAVSKAKYNGNLYAALTWQKGARARFTIETRDAKAFGSRKAASGRHMRKASWEAHYDVMEALLKIDPNAVIRTSMATYNGLADFYRKAPETKHTNVGSIMRPAYIGELSV